MTKEEQKQYIKATALNKIRKMYHPLAKHNYTHYSNEGSTSEQMNDDVRYIIEEMEKDLDKLKR